MIHLIQGRFRLYLIASMPDSDELLVNRIEHPDAPPIDAIPYLTITGIGRVSMFYRMPDVPETLDTEHFAQGFLWEVKEKSE